MDKVREKGKEGDPVCPQTLTAPRAENQGGGIGGIVPLLGRVDQQNPICHQYPAGRYTAGL